MRISASDLERIPFTCTLDCGSRCELVACLHEGRLVRVDTPPNRQDTRERPRLVPCARGRAHRRLQSLPERVLSPLRRRGERGRPDFQEIGWDEALDLVAERLEHYRGQHSPLSIMHAAGAGSVSGRGISGSAASTRFFSYWDRVTEASGGGMSNHCVTMAANWMLGDNVPGSDRATLLDSRLIIMWGMNPAENRMGPNTEFFVSEARDRGARVVLIDPRLTDSGVLADEWIPIVPGTDAAMVAAMAQVMIADGLVDAAFVERCTTGFAAYCGYIQGHDDGVPKTPEWAEGITGVPAERIRSLARAYATQRPAALLAGWGPQRQLYGEQVARGFIALAAISGNIGISGGGMAAVGTRSNRVPIQGMPFGPKSPGRIIPSVTWAHEVLSGRLDPPVRMAYIVASNLLNRSANATANARALEQLEFIVVNEPFMTPTARHADIVLPISTDLEKPDIVTSWGHDSHLFLNRQTLPAAGQSHSDYWVFAQLADRLGFGDLYARGRDERQWVETLLENAALDARALRDEGIMRVDGEPRVALADFRADPEAHPLKTQSGRIELANDCVTQYGLPIVPTYIPMDPPDAGDRYPLWLLTPHSRLRSNSCLYANPWLQELERHAVWINPRDAAERGIVQGDMVLVENENGTVRVPARVTERIMPGVICLYQGAWFNPDGQGIDDGGCANTLTAHRRSPSGGMATHTGWAQVKGA